MRNPKRFALLVFAVAFALRLAAAWMNGAFRSGELRPGTEVELIAASVAGTGVYGNPYYPMPTGPTAHATPVYPLYLAGLYALFGTGALSAVLRVVITSAVSSLRCALLPLFALDVGLGRVAAVLAAVLGIFYIGAVTTEVQGHTDGAWLALTILVLVWWTLRIWQDGRWQQRTPWMFFVFCGFCALLNPATLPVIGAFAAAGAIACPAAFRKRYLRQAALLALTIVMCLLPWAIRNSISLGKVIWTRSNFGLEFWLSNGPGREFDLPSNIGFGEHTVEHPSFNREEAGRVLAAGEVRYNQQRLEETLEWVRDNPADFAGMTLRRILAWWFPPRNPVLVAIKLVLTLLAFAGLWLLFRSQPPVAWLFLLTWVTFPDVYYVIQWSSRYRLPMDWQLVLCASVTLGAAWSLIARKAGRPALIAASG
ncbi:MAG TPA: hypothetical protein VE959_22935 [Bryobacteraceae bacterium]|nr:hypothetical protein [Bryobacteraceae bacterium]